MTLNTDVGRLPITIDEIDAAWLSDALSTYVTGTEVHDFEIVDIRHGFTTLLRIRMDLNDVGRQGGIPDTVMLKGGFEDFTRGAARAYAVKGYSLEVVSYREIWPVLGLNVPTCYFADMELDVEPDQQQTIIIMEDLLQRGVTFSDGLKPESYEQVDRRLSSLAKAHAKTWDSPELKPGGRWSGVASNGPAMFRDYMHHTGYIQPEGWQRFVDLPRGAGSSVHFHDLDWMKRALDHMSTLSDELPNCIVHGDTHLGNLYVEHDGTPGFIDSLPRREPAMVEVMYHITCALDPADRRRWDETLIGNYRDELCRNGVDAPSVDNLMHQFAAFLPYGYVTFLVNESHYQTESFNTAHAARFSAAMIDHDTKGLVDAAADS